MPKDPADRRKCTCPTTAWTGSEPNDSTCELTEQEHEKLARKAADLKLINDRRIKPKGVRGQ